MDDMRKFVTILTGFLLIAMAGVMLLASGAIFDAGKNITTVPYFFQTNDFSFERIGTPLTPSEFGATRIRDMLMRRFVYEYMYVIPNTENVIQRMQYVPQNPFARMCQRTMDPKTKKITAPVFDNWIKNVAPTIEEMAAAGALRTVRFRDDLTDTGFIYDAPSGYWAVPFDTYTWNTPNDFNAAPTKASHTMYMKFDFSMETSQSITETGIHEYLDSGGDPADLFYIGVTDVKLR